MSASRSISRRGSAVPMRSLELLPLMVSKSFMSTSTRSSSDCPASSTTIAVISFVSEAIGVTSSAALA